jgi:hypothetical protein
MIGTVKAIYLVVVAGLGPAIHEPRHTRREFPWMPGTRPGKTITVRLNISVHED